jgi:hypothetical protein
VEPRALEPGQVRHHGRCQPGRWRRSSRRCRKAVGVRVETSRGGCCAGRGLYCLCTRRVSHPGGTQMYSYRPSLSHHSSRNKGSDHPSSLTQSSPHGYPTIDIVHSHVQGTRYRQHVHVALPASDQLLHVEVCVIQLTCVSNDC